MNNMENTEKAPRKEGFWQFIKFLIVGVSNTAISELVYLVLIYFDFNYIFASIMGFVLSVLNAFYWSNKYVFKENPESKRVWWKVLLKTYAAYSWGYLISLLLLFIWVDLVKLPNYMGPVAQYTLKINKGFDAVFLGQTLAELMSLLITIPMNFIINKFWAYK
ncbi:MAG: GtrA family protein [Lachnospiraceae bacterium]|nr:GtrA family protein [Lachnospiraceae bacterium]